MVKEPVTNAHQDTEAYPDPNTLISTFRTYKLVVLSCDLVGSYQSTKDYVYYFYTYEKCGGDSPHM